MIAYTRDEIISASEMARGISTILNDLKTKKKERYVISRNNKIEAVMLSIETYEYMKEALNSIEKTNEH